MIRRRSRECRRHAVALADFAAGSPAGPETSVALAHLERCQACERDLAATELVVTGLRRMGAAGRQAEPPADGWDRVERRLARPATASRWAWLQPLRGLLAPLAGALVAPIMLAGILAAPAMFQSPGPIATGDAGTSAAAVVNAAVPAASSGPVVVGDSVAMGDGRAVVPGLMSELESNSLTPAVTPAPSPEPWTESPQPPLPSAPVRSTGAGPV